MGEKKNSPKWIGWMEAWWMSFSFRLSIYHSWFPGEYGWICWPWWTRLNLGKFARVAFRGHRTRDVWLLTLNVQLLLPWLRTATRPCSWSLTQRISSFFRPDPGQTCLTFLCTLQPKHGERHDSLFWEESAFQHWSLQKWQKLTKVVDTSLLHKRTVGSTSTLFGSCLDWYASTLSKDCAKDITQHQTPALSRRWTRCFFRPFETL